MSCHCPRDYNGRCALDAYVKLHMPDRAAGTAFNLRLPCYATPADIATLALRKMSAEAEKYEVLDAVAGAAPDSRRLIVRESLVNHIFLPRQAIGDPLLVTLTIGMRQQRQKQPSPPPPQQLHPLPQQQQQQQQQQPPRKRARAERRSDLQNAVAHNSSRSGVTHVRDHSATAAVDAAAGDGAEDDAVVAAVTATATAAARAAVDNAVATPTPANAVVAAASRKDLKFDSDIDMDAPIASLRTTRPANGTTHSRTTNGAIRTARGAKAKRATANVADASISTNSDSSLSESSNPSSWSSGVPQSTPHQPPRTLRRRASTTAAIAASVALDDSNESEYNSSQTASIPSSPHRAHVRAPRRVRQSRATTTAAIAASVAQDDEDSDAKSVSLPASPASDVMPAMGALCLSLTAPDPPLYVVPVLVLPASLPPEEDAMSCALYGELAAERCALLPAAAEHPLRALFENAAITIVHAARHDERMFDALPDALRVLAAANGVVPSGTAPAADPGAVERAAKAREELVKSALLDVAAGDETRAGRETERSGGPLWLRSRTRAALMGLARILPVQDDGGKSGAASDANVCSGEALSGPAAAEDGSEVGRTDGRS